MATRFVPRLAPFELQALLPLDLLFDLMIRRFCNIIYLMYKDKTLNGLYESFLSMKISMIDQNKICHIIKKIKVSSVKIWMWFFIVYCLICSTNIKQQNIICGIKTLKYTECIFNIRLWALDRKLYVHVLNEFLLTVFCVTCTTYMYVNVLYIW